MAIFLALAPVAAIILYVYCRDEYEKEPLKMLILAFALGVVSILPALGASKLLASFGYGISPSLFQTFVYAFGVVALSEEVAKFVFLRFVLFPRKSFNEPFDGIVYSVMIGMGFATFENLVYVGQGGVPMALARMFTAVPAHAAFGIIMGYFVGLAKFETSKRPLLLLYGLGFAVLAHGLYDFFLMQMRFDGLGILAILTLVACLRLSVKAMKLHQQESPFRVQVLANKEDESKKDLEARDESQG